MSYAKVEVMVDNGIGGDWIPHTFLKITNPDGTFSYAGFAPKETGLTGDGYIDKEEHSFDISSGPIPISETEYNALKSIIDNASTNPPYYNLPYGVQCTTWALESLSDAGIIPSNLAPDTDKSEPIYDIAETIMFNPYTQAIGFGLYNLYSNTISMVDNLVDAFSDYMDKYNSLTTQDRYNLAQMITAGGMPWNYNPSQAYAPPPPRYYDPIVLDLNHDGVINTSNVNSSTSFFDIDNDGMSELAGWIDKEDGLLVYDKNNNGKIDNANELFGSETANGFGELKQVADSNNDNVINANDALFDSLKVWQDENQDGISQESELKTLDELGITSISLNSTDVNIDSNGNSVVQTATFTQNSEDYLLADVNLQTDDFLTDYRGEYSLEADSLFLPWLRGYGNVKDAHIAYSLDEDFKNYAKELSSNNIDAYAKFDTYLKKWTGLDALHKQYGIQRDALTMDDKVWIMETLAGDNFFKSSIETAFSNGSSTSNRYNTAYINDNFKQMKDRNFSLFAVQSYFKDAFEGSYYSVNQDRFIVTDQTLLNNSMVNFLNSNNTPADIITFAFIVDRLNSDFNLTKELFETQIINDENREILENVIDGKYQSILINQTNSNNITLEGNSLISGSIGNDTISAGMMGDDFISGKDGNDTIYAGEGNDTIIGGIGDDKLYSDSGSDTYIFNAGDGHDTISDMSMNATDLDTIKFGAGISSDDLIVTRNGDNLELLFNNSTDQITIQDWYMDGMEQKIEKFEFNDGTIFTDSDIESKVAILGTDGNDNLQGYDTNDIMYGKDGNDTIYAGEGNDTIIGGIGDDKLYSDSGSDTYIFNAGDGHDTISDMSMNATDLDTIKFGAGISSDDLIVTRNGDNLELLFNNSTDQITIQDWYMDGMEQKIEKVELNDGSYLTNSDIDYIIQQINAYGDEHGMTHIDDNDIRNNGELMSIVTSAWHHE